MQTPDLPAPALVAVDGPSTALLILDMSDLLCGQSPACRETVPAAKRLLDAARSAGARVVFSLGRAANQTVLTEIAPRDGEAIVRSSADKFFGTDLEQRLAGATTVVVAGTAANGAVLYTSFAACARGMTVVVAEDAISTREPLATWVARFQLLNQPGFANAANAPLAARAVTLSRSDLIAFRGPGSK